MTLLCIHISDKPLAEKINSTVNLSLALRKPGKNMFRFEYFFFEENENAHTNCD